MKVCLGYSAGVAAPAHGAQRPLFGQLYSDRVQSIEVLKLWPLDFAMNTLASTTRRPHAMLWKPVLSNVTVCEVAFGGFEQVQLSGRRRWMIQRWMCEPTTYQDAVRHEAECKAQTWRWV